MPVAVDRSVKNDYLTSILAVLVLLTVALTGLLYLTVPMPTQKGGPRLQSSWQLQRIGLAIREFQARHAGDLPHCLSELVPEYIAKTNLVLFYAHPPGKRDARWLPPKWQSDQKLVDYFSSYIYLGTNGLRWNLIALERPGIWRTNRDSWMNQRITVLFSDYRVEAVPLTLLEDRDLKALLDKIQSSKTNITLERM